MDRADEVRQSLLNVLVDRKINKYFAEVEGLAKKLEKDKAISEDELKKATDDVQKLTDKYVAKVDEKCAAKEKEIMDL